VRIGADAFPMVEMLAIYALLLAGWGLWHVRRARGPEAEPVAAPDVEPSVTAVVAPLHERGSAARRHLNRLP
jgi:hypothetical protein